MPRGLGTCLGPSSGVVKLSLEGKILWEASDQRE